MKKSTFHVDTSYSNCVRNEQAGVILYEKMELTVKLKKEGWNLTEECVQTLSDNGSITNVQTIQQKALDLDWREIGAPAFPEDVNKGKLESIPGGIVVQIQKVRNISAPKANEESQAAPRMLKLLLTDGHSVCHAIELETIRSLSTNTPPGTKILLKGEIIPVSHGLVLLKPSCVEVLGGRVAPLVDKWELNRSLAKHTRGRVGEEGGPPPWIAFGQKIVRPNISDRNFKSLGDASGKENAEFEAQRQGAIAEAARGGARKVFGGGNKPLMDRNVRYIVDMGFTQDQAEQALRQSKNNVERAMKTLQRKDTGGNRGGKEERGGRRRGAEKEEDGVSGTGGPKPSGRVSLFDFLEDKLPASNEKEFEVQTNNQNHIPMNPNSNNTSTNQQQRGSFPQRGRSDRGGGGSNRGNRGGHNSGIPRDDRSRNNNSLQNQKPPRFQNQQRYHDSTNSHPHWTLYGGSNDFSNQYSGDRSGFANSRLQRNNQEFSSNDVFSRRPQTSNNSYNSSDISEYNRNNRRFDSQGSGNNSSTGYRGMNNSGYTRHIYESAVPDVTELPYKDSTSIPPLLANSTSGFYQPSGYNAGSHSQFTTCEGQNDIIEPSSWQWKVGDKCMAKYWEDNMYYNAEVTGLSKKTCVVRFLEYGNFEEVLQDDCIPVSDDGRGANPGSCTQHNYSTSHPPGSGGGGGPPSHFSGILEFRRGGTRPYIKSGDAAGPRRTNARSTQPMYVPPAQRKDNNK